MTPERRLALITLALLFVTVTSTPRALAVDHSHSRPSSSSQFIRNIRCLIMPGEIWACFHSSYARSYLYVAYRHLSGIDFNPPEQQALADLWKDRLDFRGEGDEQEWISNGTLPAQRYQESVLRPALMCIVTGKNQTNTKHTSIVRRMPLQVRRQRSRSYKEIWSRKPYRETVGRSAGSSFCELHGRSTHSFLAD